MDISLPCSATQARAHQSANHTEMPSIPSKLIFRNSTFLPSHTHTHTHFLYKTSCIVYEVLSILAVINVQTTHSDINLGGQEMVITNQGVGYLDRGRTWLQFLEIFGAYHRGAAVYV